VLLEVAGAATAVGGAAGLVLIPALVVPLLLPLAAALLALPLEDLKEDKRFCAEDLRRIMGRRMGWESENKGDIHTRLKKKGRFDPKSNQTRAA